MKAPTYSYLSQIPKVYRLSLRQDRALRAYALHERDPSLLRPLQRVIQRLTGRQVHLHPFAWSAQPAGWLFAPANVSLITHEFCHWLLADKSTRNIDNFGLPMECTSPEDAAKLPAGHPIRRAIVVERNVLTLERDLNDDFDSELRTLWRSAHPMCGRLPTLDLLEVDAEQEALQLTSQQLDELDRYRAALGIAYRRMLEPSGSRVSMWLEDVWL